jgi:translation initiation factor IF-2
MSEVAIGSVVDYFAKVGVAAIQVTDHFLAVADTVRIKGHTTDLVQTIDSMQLEHETVQRAEVGQTVGIRVKDRVRKGDQVLKLAP